MYVDGSNGTFEHEGTQNNTKIYTNGSQGRHVDPLYICTSVCTGKKIPCTGKKSPCTGIFTGGVLMYTVRVLGGDTVSQVPHIEVLITSNRVTSTCTT